MTYSKEINKIYCPKCHGQFKSLYIRETKKPNYMVKIGKLCLNCFYLYIKDPDKRDNKCKGNKEWNVYGKIN